MNSQARIGLIDLGAMGQGLALNIAEKGYRISIFNSHLGGVEENVAQDFAAKREHRETMNIDYLGAGITGRQAQSDSSPSVNDAGNKIVYLSYSDIYTMDIDGGNKFEVASDTDNNILR